MAPVFLEKSVDPWVTSKMQ